MDSVPHRRAALEQLHPIWNYSSIASLLDSAAEKYPDRPLVMTANATFTYEEVRLLSKQIAKGLLAAGIGAGDHVALVLANYPEFIFVKAAIARIGAVAVPLNYLLRANELDYVLRQSDSKMLVSMSAFGDRNYLADLDAIAPGWRQGNGGDAFPALKQITIIAQDDSMAGRDLLALKRLGEHITDAQLASAERAVAADFPSDIVYTSGTTGKPKGVLISHDMVLRAAYASAYVRAFEDGRRIQFALPMYHVFGYVECWIATMFVGGAIIPHTTFDPVAMVETAEALKTSELVCVPLMTEKILDVVRERGFDSRHFLAMFNSGGVCRADIWDDIETLLGAKEMLTAYGMSETTASTTCTLPDGPREELLCSNGRFKEAGRAARNASEKYLAVYKAVDPVSGVELPFGQRGELLVKGAIVTKGYYNKPEETRRAITEDGWLRTGDIGSVTEDGRLSLSGRLKESYRCGGEMVMPKEIEALFDGYPGVSQVLAVGMPDPKMGEVGCLCVVPSDPEHKPVSANMIAFCAERLAKFKVPKHVVFINEAQIPLTPTGRPQKFLLTELAQKLVHQGA